MSDALVDAVAERISPDAVTFASLPLLLAQRIFLALPVEARGRACCVCRAWRDALAELSLWSRLNVQVESADLARVSVVVRGASGRARGQLRQLDLSQQHVWWDLLLPVLTANAESLRELHLRSVRANDDLTGTPAVEAVVAAAPLLQVLTAEVVECGWQDAPRVLRAEPPFAVLQMRHGLFVRFDNEGGPVGVIDRFGPFTAALADAELQPALAQLHVSFLDTGQLALMGALVDAMLARRLRELKLESCLPPAAAPLARLLAGGSLTVLKFGPTLLRGRPLFDAAGAALVADALRVNTTLTELHLWRADLCLDVGVAGALLDAITGHPSLRELRISGENTAAEDCSALGAALAALIAADAPALLALECFKLRLNDAGLAPIMEALALNHHLHELNVGDNGMSEAFARERLLPAVHANTTLCALSCANYTAGPAVALQWEIEALVRRRGQHD